MKYILTRNDLLLERLEESQRPLARLAISQISPDKGTILFEGRTYSYTTGELISINEEWTWSEILHAGADVLSMGLDMAFPGTGAIVDILNTISYLIEAQFTAPEKRNQLYLMAGITFAFVILPGPLQAAAIPLKRWLKSGAVLGKASKVIKSTLEFIGSKIGWIITEIPKWIKKALNSKLGNKLLGKFGKKIGSAVTAFTTKLKSIFEGITGKLGKNTSKVAGKVEGSVFQKSYTIQPPADLAKFAPDSPLVRSYFIEGAEKLLTPTLSKLKNLAFKPSNVKVLKKSNVAGREVLEVEIENGQKLLMYKSSGANSKTTGKQAGEWFIIPGFSPSGFFIKSDKTVNLTKGGNKYLTDMAQFLEKNGADGLSKISNDAVKSTAKSTVKSTVKSVTKQAITTLLPATTVNLLKKAFAKKAVQKAAPEITERALRKLGLVPGQSYRYITLQGKATTATITKVEGGKVFVRFGQGIGAPAVNNVSNFLENVVAAPWGRRGYTTTVPLFIKRFADMLDPNGDLSPEQIDKLAGLDPAQTSAESLAFLQEEVGSYEGDSGNYTVDQDVTDAQTALSKLGYTLAIDGKFGPETRGELIKFQNSSGLSSSSGKLDNATLIKLKELSANL